MKILIIRFSSIGDIVLTTPVIRCLKQQLPGAQVHYLTKPAYQSIIGTNPYIDKIQLLQQDWKSMIYVLKNEQFDYIIDLHHNLRTLRIKRALNKVKSFSFDKLNMQKWLLTTFKINTLPDRHIVDRYMNTAKHLGVVNDGRGLDFFIAAGDEVSYEELPASHCAGFIAVVIGATYYTKKLPLHKLIELCKGIDHPIILLGGFEDVNTGNAIAETDAIKIYNACGKFTLQQSADLIRKAKLIITHDTGLMHIAAAFNKKIISVWGNTVPAFGMKPYYAPASPAGISADKSKISEIKKLYCRPCSKIGYHKCPLGHFKCMEKQDVKAIQDAALQLIMKK